MHCGYFNKKTMHFAKIVLQYICIILKVVRDTFGFFQPDFFIYFFTALFPMLFSDTSNQSP